MTRLVAGRRCTPTRSRTNRGDSGITLFHFEISSARPRTPVVEPFAERRLGAGAEGDDALLAALAEDAEHSLVERDVREPQAGRLRRAQAAAVEDLEDRVVAQVERLGGRRGREQRLDLL